MASEYRELLLDIAREIKPEELEEMKFLCDDFQLPDIKPEAVFVKEVFNFFRALENQNMLGVDNLDWLKYLLEKAKKSDLVLRLKDFQTTKNKSKTDITLPETSESETTCCKGKWFEI
jgi:hypothetical protein